MLPIDLSIAMMSLPWCLSWCQPALYPWLPAAVWSAVRPPASPRPVQVVRWCLYRWRLRQSSRSCPAARTSGRLACASAALRCPSFLVDFWWCLCVWMRKKEFVVKNRPVRNELKGKTNRGFKNRPSSLFTILFELLIILLTFSGGILAILSSAFFSFASISGIGLVRK